MLRISNHSSFIFVFCLAMLQNSLVWVNDIVFIYCRCKQVCYHYSFCHGLALVRLGWYLVFIFSVLTIDINFHFRFFLFLFWIDWVTLFVLFAQFFVHMCFQVLCGGLLCLFYFGYLLDMDTQFLRRIGFRLITYGLLMSVSKGCSSNSVYYGMGAYQDLLLLIYGHGCFPDLIMAIVFLVYMLSNIIRQIKWDLLLSFIVMPTSYRFMFVLAHKTVLFIQILNILICTGFALQRLVFLHSSHKWISFFYSFGHDLAVCTYSDPIRWIKLDLLLLFTDILTSYRFLFILTFGLFIWIMNFLIYTGFALQRLVFLHSSIEQIRLICSFCHDLAVCTSSWFIICFKGICCLVARFGLFFLLYLS